MTLPDILISAGVMLLVVTLAVLYVVYRRLTRLGREPRHSPEQDMAHMMILLQTMRDLLGDQKQLARQLNESVDRRVTMVKGLTQEWRSEHENIQNAQTELARQADVLKAELESAQRQASYLTGQEASSFAPLEQASLEEKEEQKTPAQESDALEEKDDELVTPEELEQSDEESQVDEPEAPEQHDVSVEDISPGEVREVSKGSGFQSASLGGDSAFNSEDADSDQGEDLIDNWVGMDFGSADSDTHSLASTEEDPLSTPQEEIEEDRSAVRMAFRELTDFGGDDDGNPDGDGFKDSNGKPGQSTLRRRVYAYCDAGMGVSEIARELGVGKGEIRLILSLRQEKGE